MLSLKFASIFLLTAMVFVVQSANILFLSALPSPSHHIWNSAIANGLAARGHNVTIISPDVAENPPNRVHYIQLEGLYKENYREYQKLLFDYKINMVPLTEPISYDSMLLIPCKTIHSTNGLKTLLNYPDKFRFDLILYDFTPGACLLAFMHKFENPPLISVSAYGNPSVLNTLIGGHQYYSYAPNYYLTYDDNMTFWQRAYNLMVHTVEFIYRKYVFNAQIDRLVKDSFGAAPPMSELEERTAIALINTNLAIDLPIPLPENVIPVGGLHIQDPMPLSNDLEQFINSSRRGAVLFSLGTNIRFNLMDGNKQKIFLDAFSQMSDYHFLWKFEDELIDLPNNVIVRPWLPQSDILAHSKVKAFFTHSGLLSVQESVWRGVPIVGMPFAYDQHRNLLKSIKLGFAEYLDFHNLTTANVKKTLLKVLEDPKYVAKAKELSARFKDQKEKPLDRAIWWIEWVLRNPNCDYLKSPTLRLGQFCGNLFDVVAMISAVCTAILYVIFKLLISVSKKCFHRNLSTRNKKKKKSQ